MNYLKITKDYLRELEKQRLVQSMRVLLMIYFCDFLDVIVVFFTTMAFFNSYGLLCEMHQIYLQNNKKMIKLTKNELLLFMIRRNN